MVVLAIDDDEVVEDVVDDDSADDAAVVAKFGEYPMQFPKRMFQLVGSYSKYLNYA